MLHRRLLFSRGPTLNRPAQAVKRSIETAVYTRVHPRPPTTDHRPPTTDHRPPTTAHRPPTTDHRPPACPIASRPAPPAISRTALSQRAAPAPFADAAGDCDRPGVTQGGGRGAPGSCRRAIPAAPPAACAPRPRCRTG